MKSLKEWTQCVLAQVKQQGKHGLDRRPSSVRLSMNIAALPEDIKCGMSEIILYYSDAFVSEIILLKKDTRNIGPSWQLEFSKSTELSPFEYTIHVDLGDSSKNYLTQFNVSYHHPISAFRALGVILGIHWNSCVNPMTHLSLPSRLSGKCCFSTFGVMIDCSRNAVLQPKNVLWFLRRMALMGLNSLQLYTEDTYEIADEPFFGYLRGKYSSEELQQIDEYAWYFGIEVFPCIQTLGHLGQVLQWPAYQSIKENRNVLLVNHPETYSFIKKMIVSASKPFRSKRIHLGMDEAFGIGQRQLSLSPATSPGDSSQRATPLSLYLNHLEKVVAICHRLQLKPLIWSDMLFSLASEKEGLSGYLDTSSRENSQLQDAKINDDIRALVNGTKLSKESVEKQKTVNDRSVYQNAVETKPGALSPVYWDYFHTEPSSFEQRIDEHAKVGLSVVNIQGNVEQNSLHMATGTWTWNRFWCAMKFTMKTNRACISACRSKRIQHIFTTIWGDDGHECDTWSALPALLAYAGDMWIEKSHTQQHPVSDNYPELRHSMKDNDDSLTRRENVELNKAALKTQCAAILRATWEAWHLASELDETGNTMGTGERDNCPSNISKCFLWQDPLLSYMNNDMLIALPNAVEHYSNLYKKLREFRDERCNNTKPLKFDERLGFPEQLAKVLTLKIPLRDQLKEILASRHNCSVKVYKRHLKQFVMDKLEPLREEVDELWRRHRAMWLALNKPFGWEVIEARYGALRLRLLSLQERINSYLMRQIDQLDLPEITIGTRNIYISENSSRKCHLHTYQRLATPSHPFHG